MSKGERDTIRKVPNKKILVDYNMLKFWTIFKKFFSSFRRLSPVNLITSLVQKGSKFANVLILKIYPMPEIFENFYRIDVFDYFYEYFEILEMNLQSL